METCYLWREVLLYSKMWCFFFIKLNKPWILYSANSVTIFRSACLYPGDVKPDTVRLQGYSVRVSNDTSSIPPSNVCFQHDGTSQIPIITTNDCPRIARYVWLYNEGRSPQTILEICEVQIDGITWFDELFFYFRIIYTIKCAHEYKMKYFAMQFATKQ